MDKRTIGTVLCHYTTAAVAFEEILRTNLLMFSPFETMRDPLEAQPWNFGAAFFNTGDASAGGQLERFTSFSGEMTKLKKQTKLIAFTRDAEEYAVNDLRDELFSRGWSRARMWEQYGDGHRGVCFVFDEEKLRGAFRQQYEDFGLDFMFDGPVVYTASGVFGEIGALTLDLSASPESAASKILSEHLRNHYQGLMLTKTYDWQGEHEHRFIVRDGEEGRLLLNYLDALNFVVLGSQFPEWQEASARKLCEQAGAEIRRLEWLPEGPWPTPLDT